MGKKWRYGVILDAGSSGTRLHIYRWKDATKARKHASKEQLRQLPGLVTKDKWTKKTRPGISTFGERPGDVGPDHLQDLIDHALEYIPEKKQPDTPIFLMATAGMRLLPEIQQKALLREVCTYLQSNTKFALPDCDLHIQVIPGETEGLYGWISANYLLGGFDEPEKHQHGKGHHTYGFLDMGGASAQIAFAPNATVAEKHWDDLKLLRLRTLDGKPSEYKVFTTTWLGFGVNKAREKYVKDLRESANAGSAEIPDPCLPKGLRTTFDGELVADSAHNQTLIGTGMFAECQRKVIPMLGQEMECKDPPCLLNGQHVPPIDFDVNHFVGVSEFWHTTHGVFSKDKKAAYDFASYLENVQEFCTQNWDSIHAKIDTRRKFNEKNAQEACFKAAWVTNVLHNGIGIPRAGLDRPPASFNVSKGALESAQDKGFLDPFKAVDEVNGVEVSWTLGKMVIYAAGQVPPVASGGVTSQALPVGFGANTNGPDDVPPDFNHAGSNWLPTGDHDDDADDDDWGDAADDILDKARTGSTSGLLLFVLILVVVGYLLRKKERRLRLFSKINSCFGGRRSRRPGSPRKPNRSGLGGQGGLFGLRGKLFGGPSRPSPTSYERILEEGGDAEQFALGDVDFSDGGSSGGEYSDSSDSTSSAARSSRMARSSGMLATPAVSVELYDDARIAAGSGSAMDRSGLVVRTESRERLVPSALQMLNAGRRSRAGSPTRMKSPLMSPYNQDD